MGLFDKKNCDICGKEIKLLGNRKLDDGNCCKDCASKLSPFFTGRRKSTVDAIKKQIAYREQNQKNLALFRAGETVKCDSYSVTFSQDKTQYLVYWGTAYSGKNPDILKVSDVADLVIEASDGKAEEMQKTEDGKEVSYDPKRYTYSYSFKAKLTVNHEYIDDINFVVADDIPDNNTETYTKAVETCQKLMTLLTGKTYADPFPEKQKDQETVDSAIPEGSWKCPNCDTVNTGEFCTKCGQKQPEEPKEGEWKCPKCGQVNTGSFCSKCGEKKPEEPKEGEWECPNCHTKNTGTFCTKCGQKQPEVLKEGEWKCPKCGQVNTGNFCSKCGEKKVEPVRFCGQCGQKIEDPTVNFCPKCGSKLG